MKFAIGIEATEKSLELLDKFFAKLSFCPNYTLDIFTVQELEDQDSELKVLENKIKTKLSENKVKGNFTVEKGDPVARIAHLIKEKKIEIYVSAYEHSIFSTTFFEQIVKETEIPILVLR